ncbi:MAG: hypothetical protein HW390_2692 [Candidatus Brocadiaceae bacterium]|nr:hypothetical protein [Candidatus Brocadiaceae bacterium]
MIAGILTLLLLIDCEFGVDSLAREPVSARRVHTPATTESKSRIHDIPMMFLVNASMGSITSFAKVISNARIPVASVISCFGVSDALPNAALVFNPQQNGQIGHRLESALLSVCSCNSLNPSTPACRIISVSSLRKFVSASRNLARSMAKLSPQTRFSALRINWTRFCLQPGAIGN